MQIITSDNSFIRFSQGGTSGAMIPDSFNHCNFGEVRDCLPVLYPGDIAFQFIIEADDKTQADNIFADDIMIELIHNCDESIVIGAGEFSDEFSDEFDSGASDVIHQFSETADKYRLSATQILYNWKIGLPGFPYSLGFGDCFYIHIFLDGGTAFFIDACSNCLQRINKKCFTSVIEYRANENEFGFDYCSDPEYVNRVRLPFYLSKPQFPIEKNVFRRADGSTKVLSAIVRQTYNAITDYFAELWHRKFAIALSHDDIMIAGDYFSVNVVLESEYNIEWQEFLNYPVAQANFTVQVTPFDNSNSNCASCDEPKLNLRDDYFSVVIHEGETKTLNAVANDEILCYGYTAVLTFLNITFVNTASIDDAGIFTVHFKTPFPSATNAKIATYKITCPDGSTAEASIYGSFAGSSPAICCDAYSPAIDYTINRITWAADCQPDNGFDITIYAATTPIVATSVPGAQLYFDLPSIVTANPGDYSITILPRCGALDGDPAVFAFTIFAGGATPILAAFGDFEADACGALSTVYIIDGTALHAGINVFYDPGLVTMVIANFIAGDDGVVRTMTAGIVGGLTGTNCF